MPFAPNLGFGRLPAIGQPPQAAPMFADGSPAPLNKMQAGGAESIPGFAQAPQLGPMQAASPPMAQPGLPPMQPFAPPQVTPQDLQLAQQQMQVDTSLPPVGGPQTLGGNGMSAAQFAAILNGASQILGGGQAPNTYVPRPPSPVTFNVGSRPMVQPLMQPFFNGRG